MNGTWFDACRGRETSLALRRVTITTRGVCISVFRRISWNSLEQLDPFPPTSLFRNIAIRSLQRYPPSHFARGSHRFLATNQFIYERFALSLQRRFENLQRSKIKTGKEKGRENRSGVNRAYADPAEALQASGTCRTLLISNTCSLVLAGSTPTRGEWSLYDILSPHPAVFLFAAISLPNRETGLLCTSSLVLHVLATIGFRDSK